ncbi:MAG: ABC transporter ATP-binding protein [candidate division WOR-3 bacterium]
MLFVKELRTYFKTEEGIVKAVDGISYHVNEREIVGIVGESGCGKTVSQLSVLQLIFPPGKIVGGEVIFEGKNLLSLSPTSKEMRSIRGVKISMVFQEPMTSLNPTLSIGQQVSELLTFHFKMSKKEAFERTIELLRKVGIPEAHRRINDYPHQFSGGMRQRVMIAMAIACNPKMIIADEPTTAVDVTTQAQLLELLKEITERYGSSLVLVTHNLGIVARYAERLYVMYAGRIVESGRTKDIFQMPLHPYTVALMKCIPRLDRREKLVPIEGVCPNLVELPPTCAFLPRCSRRMKRCFEEPWPPLVKLGDREVSCYLYT